MQEILGLRQLNENRTVPENQLYRVRNANNQNRTWNRSAIPQMEPHDFQIPDTRSASAHPYAVKLDISRRFLHVKENITLF